MKQKLKHRNMKANDFAGGNPAKFIKETNE